MPKKTQCLSSGTYRVRIEEKIQLIAELRHKYPLKDLLVFTNISKSTYYYNLSHSEDKYAKIRDIIIEIYDSNYGAYGYRHITCVLRASSGFI